MPPKVPGTPSRKVVERQIRAESARLAEEMIAAMRAKDVAYAAEHEDAEATPEEEFASAQARIEASLLRLAGLAPLPAV